MSLRRGHRLSNEAGGVVIRDRQYRHTCLLCSGEVSVPVRLGIGIAVAVRMHVEVGA